MNRRSIASLLGDAGRPMEVLLGLLILPIGLMFSAGALHTLLPSAAGESLVARLSMLVAGGGLGWFFMLVSWRLLRGKSGRAGGGLLPGGCLEAAGFLLLVGAGASLMGGPGGIAGSLAGASLIIASVHRRNRTSRTPTEAASPKAPRRA